jgi:hypothetical protein
MYPRTVPGLLLCGEMALPFLGDSLLGDIADSTAMFGTLAIADSKIMILRHPATQAGASA